MADDYSALMTSKSTKTLGFAAWVTVICLAAIATGTTSLPSWIVVACVAVGPPLVARHFWRPPERTMSESIHDARR